MNPQAIVNGMAVVGIVALGIAAKFGPAASGDQVVLAAVSGLVGFIGGVGAAHAAGKLSPAPSTPPPET